MNLLFTTFFPKKDYLWAPLKVPAVPSSYRKHTAKTAYGTLLHGTVRVPTMLSQIMQFQFFGENPFLCLGGPKKLFLVPKTFFGLRNPTFWGVTLKKVFATSYGFKDINFEIAIFWHNYPWISPKPLP